MTTYEPDKTWEFKGLEIKPLSYARKNNIITISGAIPPGPTMFAVAVYGMICPEKELITGLRKTDDFIQRVMEWMEEIKLSTDDYEQLAKVFKEVLEYTEENRVRPVADLDMLADPEVGN